MSADDRRRLAAVREGEQASNAFGFDNDVVIQQQDVVAAVFDGLIHAAGEAAGTAKVGLVDDPELAPECILDLRKALWPQNFLGALVHNEDLLDVLQDVRVLRQDAGC